MNERLIAAIEAWKRGDNTEQDDVAVFEAAQSYLTLSRNGRTVGETSIEWRDDHGGFYREVIDYDVDQRAKRPYRYFVLRDDEPGFASVATPEEPKWHDDVSMDEVIEDDPEAEETEHFWDDLTTDEQEDLRGIGTEADDEQETA